MKYTIGLIALTLFLSCQNASNHKASENKADLKNGLVEEHYPSGQLKSRGEYKDGLKVGTHREWWPDGKLAVLGDYKNGKANGPMKWYSEKGHLAAQGNMIDDKRNGIWKICDWENKNYCAEGKYENEIEVGPWRSYHANGNIQRENIWENKKVISSKCWDYSGNVIDCD